MERLTEEDIFKPGCKSRVWTEPIDFGKEPELKRLFDETKKRQQALIELRDQPFENLTITI